MNADGTRKRPYRKPSLTAHGSLSQVTRAVGDRGRNDMLKSKLRTGL